MPCKNARQANSGDLIPIGSERPAVLAWLVEGCRIWQVEGLREPGAVRSLTHEYREESDVLRDFVEEKCTLSPTAQVRSGELWAAYQDWAKSAGERYPLGKKRFSQALFARGDGSIHDRRKDLDQNCLVVRMQKMNT
jgi:phage/plasmid-associated DNA primase